MPRDSSARIRSTCRSTIAACTANSSRSRAFPLVEGRDIGAPHRHHADDLVLQEHRRGEQGAEAGQALQIVAPVVGVAEHVGDLVGAPVLGGPADGGGSVPGDGVVQQVPAVLLGGLAGDAGQPEHVAVEEEQLSGPRPAQPRGVFEDGVEHRARVGDVTTERREDLAAGGGLLPRVRQFTFDASVSSGSSASPGSRTIVIVVHAPTWMRSPSVSGVSSPLPRKSSLPLRLVPLVDPRSVTVRPVARIRSTAC